LPGIHLRILGTGSYLPPRKVTNAELEGMVSNYDEERAGRSFSEWAEDVTGIRERRFADGESAEEMAQKAALAAMESAGVDDVDLVLACSFTADRLIPNMACTVADRIGQRGTGGYVLNTACGGFVSGLSTAYAHIKAGMCERVLVVAAEALSKTTSFSDPTTAIIFGDGAGAVVAGADESGGMVSPPYTASEFSDHIALDNTGVFLPTGPETEYVEKTYLKMPGGPRVLRRAITLMEEAALKSLKESPWELSDIDCMVPHQANRRITIGLAERMNVPREKVLDTIAFHGNTSGASIPLAIDAAVRGFPEAGGVSISRGDKLLLTAVGGGYSIAAAALEF